MKFRGASFTGVSKNIHRGFLTVKKFLRLVIDLDLIAFLVINQYVSNLLHEGQSIITRFSLTLKSRPRIERYDAIFAKICICDDI